jgi:hypothetical protein
MDTFYNWNQIRGLALLAILGLFVIYALMVGVWHSLEAKGTAMRVTEQEQPQSAGSALTGRGDVRATDPEQVWSQEQRDAGPKRRAA